HPATPLFPYTTLFRSVGSLQEMPGQNRQPIEQPLAHAVSLCQLKNDGMRVNFADNDRFSANDQEVSLRGVHVFVKIHAEREEHRSEEHTSELQSPDHL